MNPYTLMNKICEEEGGSKMSKVEVTSYADHEASIWIRKQEDDAEKLGGDSQ